MVLSRPYLPPDAAERLRAYKYHGADKSLIYQKLWKPLCAWAVEKLPRWLAPNVITVTALIIVCFNHFHLWWYMPKLRVDEESPTQDVPAHVFILAGIGLFVYQFLDNMDGHQARRIGMGSPLGLLMDHGCDAFNCIVGSLTLAAATQCGPTWKTWASLMSAVTVFFFNTWEEYYRGALILPIINGANEGIFVAIGCYLMTAYYGTSFWVDNYVHIPLEWVPTALNQEAVSSYLIGVNGFFESIFQVTVFNEGLQERVLHLVFGAVGATHINLKYNTVAMLFMVGTAVMTCLGNLITVWRVVNRGGDDGEHHGISYASTWLSRKMPFVHALTRLTPLFALLWVANIWFFISPDNIFDMHPRIFCWTLGLLFTKLAIHQMIAHLCSVEFHPFRRTYVPFFYVAFHVLVEYIVFNRGRPGKQDASPPKSFIDEEIVLLEFFALSSITFGHLVINTVLETAAALEVPIFTVKKKKPQ